jgi:hypothetical protein
MRESFINSVQRNQQSWEDGSFNSTFYNIKDEIIPTDSINNETRRRVTHEPHHGLFGMGFDFKDEAIVIAAGLVHSPITLDNYQTFEGHIGSLPEETMITGAQRVSKSMFDSSLWTLEDYKKNNALLLQYCPLAIQIVIALGQELPNLSKKLTELSREGLRIYDSKSDDIQITSVDISILNVLNSPNLFELTSNYHHLMSQVPNIS